MKKYLIPALLALGAALAGCAPPMANTAAPVSAAAQASANAAQLQASWLQDCLLYEGAQKAAAANMAKLSNSEVQLLLTTTHQITPICQKQPADLQDAVQKITQATVTIGAFAAVQAATGAK